MAAVSHARVSFRTPLVWCRTLGALFPRLLPFVDHPWEPPWSFAPLSVCSFCFCTFESCIFWLKILVAWVYWLAHDSCDMKPHWLTKTECETSESTGSEAGKPDDKWQTYSLFLLVWSCLVLFMFPLLRDEGHFISWPFLCVVWALLWRESSAPR